VDRKDIRVWNFVADPLTDLIESI